jgi:topoisomerase-4 subunit A
MAFHVTGEIFFEEKIYKELEKKHETWEKVLDAINKAFGPFRKILRKDITREDIIKLTEKTCPAHLQAGY